MGLMPAAHRDGTALLGSGSTLAGLNCFPWYD